MTVRFIPNFRLMHCGKFKQTTGATDEGRLITFHIRLRPGHWAGEIWKRSFIIVVRSTAHAKPEKLSKENGAHNRGVINPCSLLY